MNEMSSLHGSIISSGTYYFRVRARGIRFSWNLYFWFRSDNIEKIFFVFEKSIYLYI